MALSNWLTRAEWNGVFFAGAQGPLLTGQPLNLGQCLTNGMWILAHHGYQFKGLKVLGIDEYQKVKQVVGDDNAGVIVEWITGFQYSKRGREAIAFYKSQVPSYDYNWLVEVLEHVDQVKLN